jgi:hypothetical protein
VALDVPRDRAGTFEPRPVGGSLRGLLESQPTSLPIRLENRLAALDKNLADARAAVETSRAEIARATAQIDQPFPHRARP